MPDDASAVATIAAEPPTINFKPESFSIDWEPETETPTETEPTAPAPAEPDPVPEPASTTPEPSTEEPPPLSAKQQTDWAALTADLTKEEMDALVKSNPALKRRLDGELGSRLQAKEAAIRKEAADAAIAEYNQQVEVVNTAIGRYEEIEALQETDPEQYARDWAENTTYKKWVADLFERRDQVVSMGKVKQAATPPAADAAAVLTNFHNLAIPEAIDTIRAEAGDLYAALPAETRRAIENVTYNPESSWLQDIVKEFVKGTKTAQERTIKAAVAAAREAGRKEALAEFSEDRPVIPNNPGTSKLSADDIIREHGNNGFANITREQLEAAKAQKGLNY